MRGACLLFALLLAAAPVLGQSTFHREEAFSGVGAWRLVLDLSAGHDLSMSIFTSDASGQGVDAPASGPTGRLLALFSNGTLLTSMASVGAAGAGDVAYVSAGGQHAQIGPLEPNTGGTGAWSNRSVVAPAGVLEIVFLYASPAARIVVDAAWTQGVSIMGDGPVPGAVAYRLDDMDGGAAAGVEFSPSAAVGKRTTVDVEHALLGYFHPGANDVVSLRSCRAPVSACSPPGAPAGIIFGRGEGTWEFEVNAEASPIDPREWTLMAVPLSPWSP